MYLISETYRHAVPTSESHLLSDGPTMAKQKTLQQLVINSFTFSGYHMSSHLTEWDLMSGTGRERRGRGGRREGRRVGGREGQREGGRERERERREKGG